MGATTYKGNVVRRLKGLAISLGGLVIVIIGIGMWRSPEVSWNSLLSEWSLLLDEMDRLVHSPFAILGVIVLLIGGFLVYYGARRAVRG